jgi:hypothetical protein
MTAILGIDLATLGIAVVLLALAFVIAVFLTFVFEQIALGRDEKGTWH